VKINKRTSVLAVGNHWTVLSNATRAT